MGIGHHRPIDRVLGAETTLRTVRHAPCAVMAVPPGHAGRLRQVVIAVDFSDACLEAVRDALPLLAVDATLHLVHCWNPLNGDDGRHHAINVAYRDALPARFDAFIARIGAPKGMRIERVVREGRPADSVLVFARAHHADLIIAGRRGANLLERLFVGSVSTRLLRATTCALFIGRERHQHPEHR